MSTWHRRSARHRSPSCRMSGEPQILELAPEIFDARGRARPMGRRRRPAGMPTNSRPISRTPAWWSCAVENLHHRQISAHPGRRQHADLSDRACLAARGHDVHVVTNAKEVAPPFRMHMRRAGLAALRSAVRGRIGDGSLDRSRSTGRNPTFRWRAPSFPSSRPSPRRVHAEHPFDVIFSHYLEPYGVAGYLASQMTGSAACRSHGGQRCGPLVATSAIGSAV